ncbi:MAG: YraN family protein [Clostridia bacterium]|nr:YraN family protein [Clostridia bacterium]
MHNKKVGAQGEQRACEYLEQKGYSILHRNFRTPYGEIDIIAQKGQMLCFVEVKTRNSSAYGAPRLAVDKRKQQHLIAAAQVFLQQNEGFLQMPCRFDVIECMKNDLQHIPDAFRV